MKDKELEIKYYVENLARVEAQLQKQGGQLVQPRTYELNLRFDTPGGDLVRTFRVLRLRQDTSARLTYKGPMRSVDGVRVRTEIEFKVEDFETAKAFLEALDYQVSMSYEKYRAVYDIEGVSVTLDEMPYGDFVEIEGPDTQRIQMVNQRLGLNWERRVPESYIMLFDRLRQELALEFTHLTFDNFKNIPITPADLHVLPADDFTD